VLRRPGQPVIDLHCHILPGLDDGAESMGDSVDIARDAAADGVSTIVATPHVREDYNYNLGEIARRTSSVNEILAQEGIDLRVVPGAEVGLTRALELNDADLLEICLGAGPYLLVESPYGHASDFFEDMIFKLQLRGFQPVLAHPERSPSLMRDISRVRRLVDRGVLCSVTAGSMAGRFGGTPREATRALFAEGLVHNVASDAHDVGRRPPGLSVGFDALEDELPGLTDHARWFTDDAPGALLAGQHLPPPPSLEPLRTGRRWWRRGAVG
jgi:protein-tyrosine phosphatase